MQSSHPAVPSISTQRLLTAGLLIAQAAYIFISRRNDYFLLDDFLNFIQVYSLRFWTLLGKDLFGQFVPLYRLLNVVYIRWLGMDYVAVHVLETLAVWAATLALLRLGRNWNAHPAIPIILAVFFPFSPIFVTALQWLSAGTHVVAIMAFGAMAVTLLCRDAALTIGRRIAGAAVFMLGLLCYAKTLFVLVLIFSVRLYVHLKNGRPLRDGIFRAIGDLAPSIGVAAIYLSIVVLGNYGTPQHTYHLATLLNFVRISWTDGFAANLLGVDPNAAGMRILPSVLLVIPAVLSIRRDYRTAIIWAGFAAQFAFGAAAIGSARFVGFGYDTATISRHHADSFVFFIACMMMTLPAPQDVESAVRRWVQLAPAAAVAFALLLRCSLSVPLIWAEDDGRIEAYVNRLHDSIQTAALRPIAESAVPDWVMPLWMAPLNRMSYFSKILHVKARFTEGKDATLAIAPDGTLHPTGIPQSR